VCLCIYIYIYTYIFLLLSSTSHRPSTHNGVRASNVTKTGSSWSCYSRIYAEGMRKTPINRSKDSPSEINMRDLQNAECKLDHSILRHDAVLFGNLLRYFGKACCLRVGSDCTERCTLHTQSYEEVKWHKFPATEMGYAEFPKLCHCSLRVSKYRNNEYLYLLIGH
jgi:hypothetical protein